MPSASLPHWDMQVVFPGLDSPEFDREFSAMTALIADLGKNFDSRHIQKSSSLPLTKEARASFNAVAAALNPLLERCQTLRAYIVSFVATDSRNTLAQAKMSDYLQATLKLDQLMTRLTAWLGSLDVEALLAASPELLPYQFMIRQAALAATHLMSPAEEDLAAELNLSAGGSWSRMYGNLTSQIPVTLEIKGEEKTLPMSAVRNLAYDADGEVRRKGYEAELAAWQANALPLAAALNGIKGEVNTLAYRRGWESPLSAALFDNAIDRDALAAMLQTAREYFPHFRRYLQAKARLLNQQSLPWYDLFAPVGKGKQSWSYEDAQNLIIDQFTGYSSRMGEFAARAFRENWIDAEPRSGKRDGAFCMGLRRDESRVLTNFQPGFKSVLTLAHELGHAYHNLNLASQPMLNRDTPMTLAETASIFCETIVRNALLSQVSANERLSILEGALVNSTQIVVDISSRFLFEEAVFSQRQKRDLSIDELCAHMEKAQVDTYGDGLDPRNLHPYMWAAKQHYYSTGRSFYNYPYMFGLLFGLGLFARYQQDPSNFKQWYDLLLSSTGQANASTLARGMDIDIHSPGFWRSSLETIRSDIDQFVALVP